MARKPARSSHRRSSQFQPLTCSPFARSIARVSSAYMAKCKVQESKLRRKSHQDSKGNGVMEHAPKRMNEQSESSEGEEAFDGVVQADFAFFDPKPDDFHGVKTLLQSYLDDMQWDLSGFVDLILDQTTVGTVIKIEDDEDDGLFSVITALNLRRYKDHKCIMEVKDFLLKVCQQKDIISDLRSLLGDQAQNVGLLVSERVVNLPPQLLPPLYDALFDEVSWAKEDEPTEELRNSFCFKFYLLVSKVYKLKNVNQRKKSSSDGDEEMIYIKPEDEIFHKLSSWSFAFPMHTQQVSPHELRNYQLTGLVMAVKAENISTFREQLRSLIDES
ncbi:hypothetical protein SLA2020_000170 [Shorea laevis]